MIPGLSFLCSLGCWLIVVPELCVFGVSCAKGVVILGRADIPDIRYSRKRGNAVPS
jgi:hypothetical protein